jgi:hemolysin activation/secretion protein
MNTGIFYKRLCLAVSFFVFIGSSAFAQERSGEVLQQLERKELMPSEKPKEPPVIEKEEKPKIKFAEEEKIFVKQFKVEGATILDAKTIRTLIEPYENMELTLDDISIAAEAITNAYRKKGYITVYSFIPVQEIKDGIVVIRVIEGKIGEILVTGNKHYSSEFIQRHIDKAGKDPSIKEQTLERAILILNEYPSLNVKTSLKAGKKPGTVDIIAAATDRRHISAGISYDNFGSATISKHRSTVWIDMGGLAADGDLLMLRGTTGLDRIDLNKLSYGRIEYLIPVDYNGTRLGMYYANSVYAAGENLAPLEIKGKAHTTGIYATHPLIKQRDRTLTVRAGFDYKEVYDYMLSNLRSKDDIRAINIGVSYDFFDLLEGRSIVSLAYYQGIPDILGGAGKDEQGTSRAGADGGFSKFTVDFARVQGITDYSHFLVRASGQISGGALFSAEQFSIGGMGTVRGFKPSLYSGDSGYLLSAELHFSPPYPETNILGRKLGNAVKFVLFADHAGTYRNNVQPGENKDDYLTSIGAGIRLYEGKRFSFKMDWAAPKIDGKFNTGRSQTYVQATMAF